MIETDSMSREKKALQELPELRIARITTQEHEEY